MASWTKARSTTNCFFQQDQEKHSGECRVRRWTIKKWVINLSKYKLTKAQESELAKGLNYAPTPDKIPVKEYIVASELACQKLSNNEAMVLRSEMAGILSNAKPPKSNITCEERILPAGKGYCVNGCQGLWG